MCVCVHVCVCVCVLCLNRNEISLMQHDMPSAYTRLCMRVAFPLRTGIFCLLANNCSHVCYLIKGYSNGSHFSHFQFEVKCLYG